MKPHISNVSKKYCLELFCTILHTTYNYLHYKISPNQGYIYNTKSNPSKEVHKEKYKASFRAPSIVITARQT